MKSGELGFVLIFVALLGMSNYFVKHMKLKKLYLIFYYIFIGSLGMGLMTNTFKIRPNMKYLLGR